MVKIGVVIPEQLRERLLGHVLSERITMSEYVARAVAHSLGCPELGDVPRSLPGRKPKRPTTKPVDEQAET